MEYLVKKKIHQIGRHLEGVMYKALESFHQHKRPNGSPYCVRTIVNSVSGPLADSFVDERSR